MNHETPSRRPEKIAGLMQREIASLIQHEIHDPRLPKWMTILDVQVSKDLGHARVYFTVIDESPDEVLAVLTASVPFLRTALAKSLRLRKVPKLSFVYDASVEYGKRLNRLIDKVNPDENADSN